MRFSIADDYDPDGDMSAESDSVPAYLTFLEDKRARCRG